MILAFGLLSNSQEQIIRHYGFIPDQLLSLTNYGGGGSNINTIYPPQPLSVPLSSTSSLDIVTRLLSSMFIHTNIAHLAFNILALVYLGGFAERSVGILRYIFIYILAGIAGALFYGVITTFILGNSHTVLIGASGAISGILGIAAAAGNTRAYYWLLIQIVFAIVGSFTAIPIAFTAHIGGFIAGVLLTKVLIVAEQKKRINI
ncbi:MAG: rhomboid family intramembrane serine protease [Nitrososphaeraceae archaeon]